MLVAVLLVEVLFQLLVFYSLLLFVRVLLTWFPSVPWDNPVLAALSAVTDPYLNVFRGLIPPVGGIDLSAILAFLALNVMSSLLRSSLYSVMAMG